MNPQTQKLITLLGTVAAGAIASAAVTHGVIKSSDQTVVTDAIIGVFGFIGVIVGAVYKNRQNTPTALVAAAIKTDPVAIIAAVNNTNNGLKVVAADGPGVPEAAPLK